ncbi:MAG: dNTP triphosphohydrolase [Bacteroidetes bacterium]|nr:dNTP triphosphohydrolase [Bacteroidota bacterium]
MHWASLYSDQRSGTTNTKARNPDQARTSFVRDYDRIIFSSAFRRLQNKTQVFPLPGAVFVHNRLTHSLEVASVGRSLAQAVGDSLADRHFKHERHADHFYRHEFPFVVAAACLAHDIGNPPFGHAGEDAIRSFFLELEPRQAQILQDELSANQLADFQKFEGNANAYRILSHSYNEPLAGGYKLTLATLAAIVKYPCNSLEGFDKYSGLIATKKSGFFDSEKEEFRTMAATLGMLTLPGYESVFARHPFVYLVEAADDICYRVIDLEDAHRLGICTLQKFKELFLPFFEQESGYDSLAQLEATLSRIRDENQQVQYIRARWIGLMVAKLKDCFLNQEDALLRGVLNCSLLELLPGHIQELLKMVNAYSVAAIYRYKGVLEIEVAGYHVIGGLLKSFVDAALNAKRYRSQQLLRLVPQQYLITGKDRYADVQSVVDFVSGMTDLYALDLYQKITGINIPELK